MLAAGGSGTGVDGPFCASKALIGVSENPSYGTRISVDSAASCISLIDASSARRVRAQQIAANEQNTRKTPRRRPGKSNGKRSVMNFWSEGMSRQKLFHEYRIACSSSAPSEPLCWHRVRPASSTAQFSTKGQQWQIRLNQDVELSRNLGIPAESQKFIKDLQQRVRSFRHQIAVHGVKSRRVRLFCFLVLVISRGIQHSSPGKHPGNSRMHHGGSRGGNFRFAAGKFVSPGSFLSLARLPYYRRSGADSASGAGLLSVLRSRKSGRPKLEHMLLTEIGSPPCCEPCV